MSRPEDWEGAAETDSAALGLGLFAPLAAGAQSLSIMASLTAESLWKTGASVDVLAVIYLVCTLVVRETMGSRRARDAIRIDGAMPETDASQRAVECTRNTEDRNM